MAQKPSIPKGTRDFSPAEMAGRNYIFDTVRTVFKKYGYSPLETPSMENLSTLLGKYGDEGDKLLFKVLNSGDAFAGVAPEQLGNSNTLSLKVCEKGLRYDLTVPFARYVVQNQNEITFPFKRYQIQPVWRADRPQKGRYREFYQCDVDVVGLSGQMIEAECLNLYVNAFQKLGIEIEIEYNSRNLMRGLILDCSVEEDKISPVITIIDKMDKLSKDEFKETLQKTGLNDNQIEKLLQLFTL